MIAHLSIERSGTRILIVAICTSEQWSIRNKAGAEAMTKDGHSLVANVRMNVWVRAGRIARDER